MIKKILAGSILALCVIGCGGSGGSSGTSYVYGVNALPNEGALSITANGTLVMNGAGYGLSSSAFVGVNSGANATVFLTNSGSTQLASGTTTFTANEYYTAFALGNTTNQYVFLYPQDATIPVVNTANITFVNCSVLQPSVDVYCYVSGGSPGTPVITSMTPFNSGFEVKNLTAGQTYTVQYNTAGTQTILGTTTVTTGTSTTTNMSQIVAFTDNQTSVTPAQQFLPIIAVPVTANAIYPRFPSHATVLGHPGMTSFPTKK